MPPTTSIRAELRDLIDRQDGVVTSAQLSMHGFSRDATQHRVGRREWQRLLPGVVLTHSGEPLRRQRLFGAWLWAGEDAAIDGASACQWYGALPSNTTSKVHLVVPASSPARSQSFVVVRRTLGAINVGDRGFVPYVDLPTALIVAARGASGRDPAVAVLSRALQRDLTTVRDLQEAREGLGDKWCRQVDRALIDVGVGVRSPAERVARDLILTSARLPEPEWNVWLDLGDGGAEVCVDGLWIRARLVHEVNGKRYHAWDKSFEDMQARHDRLTAAGLIALHNAPRRLRREGALALDEIERTHARYDGLGLPANVRVVPPPTRLRIA